MFDCFLKCLPWDLLDEGADVVLDRLQGEVGATGIELVAVTDEVTQFRPHLAATPRIVRTPGGLCYQPTNAHYESTRLKPQTWNRHSRVDAVARASEICAERQLDLRVGVTPFHARRTLARHTDAACKNAFGISSQAALCPANPDVQAYLVAVMNDLSQYDDVSAVVLNEVQPPPATEIIPYMSAHAMLGGDAAALLAYCFCESSLQAAAQAGVDGQAALRAVRTLLDRFCQQGRTGDDTAAELLEGYPAIARYVEWTDHCLMELFHKLRQASSKSLIFSFESSSISLVDLPYADQLLDMAERCLIDAQDLEQVIEALNRGEAFAEHATPASVGKMELLVSLDDGLIDDAPEVVRQMTLAAEAGAGGVTVSHYGAILEKQFAWVHQGLRNARRVIEQ